MEAENTFPHYRDMIGQAHIASELPKPPGSNKTNNTT